MTKNTEQLWFVSRHRDSVTITTEKPKDPSTVYLVHLIRSKIKPIPDDFIKFSLDCCCMKYSCLSHLGTSLLEKDEPKLCDDIDVLPIELTKFSGPWCKSILDRLPCDILYNDKQREMQFQYCLQKLDDTYNLSQRYRYLREHYYG